MARPRSEDKRSAILQAAVRVIDKQGLSAPTALIAREAGVANGSLFTYFETKADLFNQLYIELKTEVASTALKDLLLDAPLRDQFSQAWTNWVNWAINNIEKKRVLSQLTLSEDITSATKEIVANSMVGLVKLMKSIHEQGSMHDAPFEFVAGIMNSLADATMDQMIRDPKNSVEHSNVGFEAFWRVMR